MAYSYSDARSNTATPRPRKKLCVTIDEADNFGLVLVKKTSCPLIGASEALLDYCQNDSAWQGKLKCGTWTGQISESVLSMERHAAIAPDEFSYQKTSRPSSALYSESLR